MVDCKNHQREASITKGMKIHKTRHTRNVLQSLRNSKAKGSKLLLVLECKQMQMLFTEQIICNSQIYHCVQTDTWSKFSPEY